MYILLRENTETANVHFVLYGKHALNEIKYLTFGLFYQWFRIETDKKTMVFITRNHHLCHDFIENLEDIYFQTYKKNLRKQHFNQQTLYFISSNFCLSEAANDLLESYFLAYYSVPKSNYQGCYTINSMNGMPPSSLSFLPLLQYSFFLVSSISSSGFIYSLSD